MGRIRAAGQVGSVEIRRILVRGKPVVFRPIIKGGIQAAVKFFRRIRFKAVKMLITHRYGTECHYRERYFIVLFVDVVPGHRGGKFVPVPGRALSVLKPVVVYLLAGNGVAAPHFKSDGRSERRILYFMAAIIIIDAPWLLICERLNPPIPWGSTHAVVPGGGSISVPPAHTLAPGSLVTRRTSVPHI